MRINKWTIIGLIITNIIIFGFWYFLIFHLLQDMTVLYKILCSVIWFIVLETVNTILAINFNNQLKRENK